ncbi:ParB N-terminal domain-containing protein [Undibacterium sp. SXout7W]|uniref:ParB N-terminal domain-containing protein n=1 Tax=Undibacterium sp. SXout7W TaxID=3413049 RepID=UPI003BF0808C
MSILSSYPVVLESIDFFLASEEVDYHDVQNLAQQIADRGMWIMPVPVERHTGIIMDGNHRLRAARLLGLSHLPCILLDYNTPGVSVLHWDSGEPFSIAKIYQVILREHKIFAYKTTRHVFEPALPACEISIASLRQINQFTQHNDERVLSP